MDPAFQFLVLAAVTYIAFLCVIRLAMGSQYKSKSFLVNVIGMITVYGSFILSRFGGLLKLPSYFYYIIIIAITVFLPPISLKMKSNQTLKYYAFSIVFVLLLHLLFSLLLGWNEFLPFIKVPSLWDII